ncbi:MAG TPA: hypothetical protein VF852_18760 [Pseudolabrys sp.]
MNVRYWGSAIRPSHGQKSNARRQLCLISGYLCLCFDVHTPACDQRGNDLIVVAVLHAQECLGLLE